MTTIYTLNDAGIHQIKTFVREYGMPAAIPAGWYGEAELAADDAWNAKRAEHAVIEIGAGHSFDGQPHTLVLETAWFDAETTTNA
jgi:hypothetical protein